jgi:hypothetical protein
MWFALGVVVILAFVLAAAWAIDRSAAKRGLKVNIRHSGLRREVTFTRMDDGRAATWRGDSVPEDDAASDGSPDGGQNRGGSR